MSRVAIIGAGPYGLAAATALRAAGVDTVVLGEPMRYWRLQMPAGMLLRSPWDASHIGATRGPVSLHAFEAARREPLRRPIPLRDFVAYGEWVQERIVPDLDRRRVASLARRNGGFRLRLAEGEELDAKRVIVATGLERFPRIPPALAGLPAGLVSHVSAHADLAPFAGRRVAVVGGGQSALESAALLAEAGVEVEVLVRAPQVHWLGRSARLHRLAPVRRLLYAPSDIGPPGLSWLVHLPALFRRFPRRAQDRMAARAIRPAASSWVRPRVGSVRISTGCAVERAAAAGGALRLALAGGGERCVDHVVCATGYRVDLDRLDVLDPELRSALARIGSAPRLGPGFESSVPGLHFVGAAAAASFGPLMRFVAGTDFASRSLAAALAGRRR